MKTKIVAIIVSPASVVLYKEDGESFTVLQGNIASPESILNAIKSIKETGQAELDLRLSDNADEYKIFEAKTGIARFFRVARSYVASLFGENGTLIPQEVGDIPESPEDLDEDTDCPDGEEDEIQNEIPPVQEEVCIEPPPSATEVSREKHRNALKEIMDEAPHTKADPHKGLNALDISKHEEGMVTVAVVDDTIIPNAEGLKSQLDHAAHTNRTQGINALLSRLSVMIHERAHSAEDLVSFLSTGDLPVMDDGSILAYKRVTSSGTAGVYVDTHSKKVRQRVGSEVRMDIKHVDPSRRNSCSYGLHVATRSYLRTFSGDTILLIKVAPEDAIAVPTYQNTKIRVCRYQVIGKASPEMFKALLSRDGTDAFDKDDTRLLNNYLRGNHPPVDNLVLLKGKTGEDIEYSSITPDTSAPTPQPYVGGDGDVEEKATLHVPSKEEDEEQKKKGHSLNVRDTVTPKPVAKEETEIIPEKEKPQPAKPKAKAKPKTKTAPKKKAAKPTTGKAKANSPRAQMAALLPVTTKAQAEKALAVKRKAKKGWKVLGVSDEESAAILHLLQ